MKTLFFGTPDLAVPFLHLVARETELKAVVSTPDEPAGRGYELQPTPIKQAALKLQLPVHQPDKLKDPAFLQTLESYQADVAFVVAYGKLLPPALLGIPRLGFMNVHFSLLPAYRGAAPIQRALMAGEKETGVSLFWLDEGMDTGPIFLKRNMPILEKDDAESLRQKLVTLGLEMLQASLKVLSGSPGNREPQQGTFSLAPSLKKEEGKIEWSQSARSIANLIRGTNPWPGAFCFIGTAKPTRLKVLRAQVLENFSGGENVKMGEVVCVEKGRGIVVKCGQDFLEILQVQPEGKRPMSAWDFWQGARLKIGEKLG